MPAEEPLVDDASRPEVEPNEGGLRKFGAPHSSAASISADPKLLDETWSACVTSDGVHVVTASVDKTACVFVLME